mmetsp:Transcript_15789/g.32435  ORF Transcript_15789/g.32435 Transcript_15789/m.32435 type:complete len:368 (+) Transcript_15789:35-1138(+)
MISRSFILIVLTALFSAQISAFNHFCPTSPAITSRIVCKGVNKPLITALRYKEENDVEVLGVKEAETKTGSVNFGMLKNIVRNQGLLFLGSTWTSERWGWENYPWSHIHVNPLIVMLGLVVGAGIIKVGKEVEDSSWKGFGDINKSTVEMVIGLFGREEGIDEAMKGGERKRIVEVGCLALGISLVTAIAEETCFRGQLLSALTATHDPATAVVVGAVLFGLAHVNLSGGVKDNFVTIGLHTVTGTGFGAAFILGGGNLAGCIVAHMIYDFQVFFDTWYRANSQMDYANVKGGDDAVSVWFHNLDIERTGRLGRVEFERGLSYAMGWRKPGREEMDEVWGDRVDLNVEDFKNIVGEIRARRVKGGRG